MALASSSKELHQIVNALSKRHPPKILSTIYPSADLPSLFIRHFGNKVEKPRANIASEHVSSTFVTGTTTATFFPSVPNSHSIDPILSKFIIQCLISIISSLSDLLISSLTSGVLTLVTPTIKKRCLDHNDLNNCRPVYNLCFIAEIREKLLLSQTFFIHQFTQSLQHFSFCILS